MTRRLPDLPPVSPGCLRVRIDSFNPLTGEFIGEMMSGLHDGEEVHFDIASPPGESERVATLLAGCAGLVVDLDEAGINNWQEHDK